MQAVECVFFCVDFFSSFFFALIFWIRFLFFPTQYIVFSLQHLINRRGCTIPIFWANEPKWTRWKSYAKIEWLNSIITKLFEIGGWNHCETLFFLLNFCVKIQCKTICGPINDISVWEKAKRKKSDKYNNNKLFWKCFFRALKEENKNNKWNFVDPVWAAVKSDFPNRVRMA